MTGHRIDHCHCLQRLLSSLLAQICSLCLQSSLQLKCGFFFHAQIIVSIATADVTTVRHPCARGCLCSRRQATSLFQLLFWLIGLLTQCQKRAHRSRNDEILEVSFFFMGLSENSACASHRISCFLCLPPLMEHHSNSCLFLLSNLVAVHTNGVSDHRLCVPLAGMPSTQGHFLCQLWLLAAMHFLTSLSTLGQSLLGRLLF